MPYLFPGVPSRLPAGAGATHASTAPSAGYEQWYAAVGGPAGYPYAPPAQYGAVAYGATPYVQYGAVAFGAAAKPKQHKIDLEAAGAREIRVWQVNHGGKRHIKNILASKGTFKTHKKVKGKRADNPALLKFRVFWKKSAGGGSSWHGPIRFGTSKSWTLTRPVGLPAGETGKDKPTGTGGGEITPGGVLTAVTDVATSWADRETGTLDAGSSSGAPGALPGWLVPAGVGVAVGVPVLALVVKRLRKRGEPTSVAEAPSAGLGARRRRW